jgi:hypothetical protein
MHALMNDTGVTWRKSSPCATHQSGRPPPLSSRISSIAKIMTHVHSSGRSPNFIVHLSSIQISPATFERWRQECLVASAQISSQGFPLRWKAPTILKKKSLSTHAHQVVSNHKNNVCSAVPPGIPRFFTSEVRLLPVQSRTHGIFWRTRRGVHHMLLFAQCQLNARTDLISCRC